ncbi:MAG: nucleotide exchange factor GrpE [Gemmataceae bacterium]|nr:nucleotide exchange factor GrpE [Gemmataceae bacterium]
MNEDRPLFPPVQESDPTVGMSSVYRLLEAFIALREKNGREHRLFETTLNRTRDTLQTNFNSFAGETQKAFQALRTEIHGEKRFSLVLLNELVDIALELDTVLSSRPELVGTLPEMDACRRWFGAVEVQNRKLHAALEKFGVHAYDAVVGAAYNPALHERIGGKRIEGMGPLLVAEQSQRGYASQQPEFVLRRPKVYVTE